MKVVGFHSVNGRVLMGVTEVDNTLSAMQKFVGGYIEVVNPIEDYPEIVCVCDEEGLLKGKPATIEFDYCTIHGNCFLCETNDEGEFVELRKEYISMLLEGVEG